MQVNPNHPRFFYSEDGTRLLCDQSVQGLTWTDAQGRHGVGGPVPEPEATQIAEALR